MYMLAINYITRRAQENFYIIYFYYLYIHIDVYIFNIPNLSHIISCQGQREVHHSNSSVLSFFFFGLYMKPAVYQIYEIMRKA